MTISKSKYDTYLKRFNNNIDMINSFNMERVGIAYPLENGMLCSAIFMDNNKIVSIGFNKPKTHPMFQRLGYYRWYDDRYLSFSQEAACPVHAELDAYLKIIHNNISHYNTLYIYRGLNSTLPSTPCISCASWIRKLRNLTICYINSDYNFECVKSEDLLGHKNFRNRVVHGSGNIAEVTKYSAKD